MQSARVYVTSEHQVEVSGAHASKIANRGAASVAVLQGGPAPLLAGVIRSEAAPPFAMFEGWAPAPMSSGTSSYYLPHPHTELSRDC